MMMSLRFLVALLFLHSSRSIAKDDNDQCDVYLAVSSKATDEGLVWGLYAGKDYAKGDAIGNPDLAVNVINLRANALMEEETTPEAIQAPLIKALEFLEESFWIPDPAGGKFEIAEGRIITSIAGAGSLGAYEMKLVNADWNHKPTYQRKSIGEQPGVAHPNRGAISPFYNVVLRSTDEIKAGSEIFINYGANWEDESLKDELIKPDFARIDETVDQMIEFFAKHKEELDNESKVDIYNFITNDVMNAAVGPRKAKKIAAILPRHPDDLVNVKKAGGALPYSQPLTSRSLEWLRQHGRCIDNIQSGASTIPGAGRGAFAKRAIKKGAVISPVPVLQVPDKALFDMHELYMLDTGDYARESNSVVGQQLLVNYCFGHPSSTMLFVPTGSNVGLINHSDKPNSRLVWSNHPSNQKQWFQLNPHQLTERENAYVGLLFDVVATRDIKQGEEVFLDYGLEWTAAWAKHVGEWENRVKNGVVPKQWPTRALDLNDEYRSKPYKIKTELEKNPYPETVYLTAFLMLTDSAAKGTLQDPKSWTEPMANAVFTSEHIFEVTVVDRVKVPGEMAMPYNYTIQWTNDKEDHVFVKDVPHHAFVFVDEPETGDQYTVKPFRHYVGIPDDIFPQGPWRNI